MLKKSFMLPCLHDPKSLSLIVNPNNLVGMILFLDKEGVKYLRVRMFKPLDDFEGDLAQDSCYLKFIFTMNDDTIEEIFTLNKLLDHINNSQEDHLIELKFKEITGHEGPLPRTHPNHNL